MNREINCQLSAPQIPQYWGTLRLGSPHLWGLGEHTIAEFSNAQDTNLNA
jgi:hypothetical protein